MSARMPPGPRGNWLVGCLPEFRRDMLGFYQSCARDFGDCVGFRLGFQPLCLATHPDYIEFVLTHGARHFSKRTYVLRLLEPVLGKGLLTSEGDVWLRQRRLAQPAFGRQHIVGHAPMMVSYA